MSTPIHAPFARFHVAHLLNNATNQLDGKRRRRDNLDEELKRLQPEIDDLAVQVDQLREVLDNLTLESDQPAVKLDAY